MIMQTYSVSRGSAIGRVFMGLFGTLLTASIGVYASQYMPPAIVPIAMVVELVMIIAAMFLQRRRSIGYGFVYSFTFISGITLYPYIASYTMTYGPGLVLQALLVTAGAFLISAIVASRTSLDFSFLGGFLFVGLMAILLMGIVSLFTGFSTVASLIYSLIGIGVFIGYILYDVNRIARQGIAEQNIPWVVLTLYLDIVNLFLFILRLMGIMQSSRR